MILNPFLDSEGLIRVGRRLLNSPLAYSEKYPLISPLRQILTEYIVEQGHENSMQADPYLLLSAIQETYKSIGVQEISNEILAKLQFANVIMGTLRSSRNHRFESYKRHIFIVICVIVKVIALEMILDLWTGVFLDFS